MLAAEGAIAVIIGRNESDNLLTVNKVVAADGKAFQVVAKLSAPDECKTVVKAAVDKLGRIDGLVNNAGVNDGVGLKSGNYESFIASLHKNLVRYYLLAHDALPALIKS